jgi:hypothetical protein
MPRIWCNDCEHVRADDGLECERCERRAAEHEIDAIRREQCRLAWKAGDKSLPWEERLGYAVTARAFWVEIRESIPPTAHTIPPDAPGLRRRDDHPKRQGIRLGQLKTHTRSQKCE